MTTISKTLKEVLEKNQRIQNATTDNIKETKHQKQTRLKALEKDYDLFFRYYFPHYCDDTTIKKRIGKLAYDIGGTPCAQYHKEMFENLRDNKIINQFNIIYRGGAKSVHGNMGIPFHLIFFQKSIKCMAIVSATQSSAEILLEDLKLEFESNQRLINDFGNQVLHGNWATGDFKIKDNVRFIAKGINQQIVGLRNGQYRLDYASIDDAEELKHVNNTDIIEERVERVQGDITEAFSKDVARLCVNNNLRSEKGLIDGLLRDMAAQPNTRITLRQAYNTTLEEKTYLHKLINRQGVNITHRDERLPDGEPTWCERYTKEYWEDKETRTLLFGREYMHKPGIKKGKVFKQIFWKPMPRDTWHLYDIIVAYGDLSWKKKGDFKAVKVVGFLADKAEYHNIKSFVRRAHNREVAKWCYDLQDSLPDNVSIEWWYEANFAQDMFKKEFVAEGIKRGWQLPIRADKSKKPDKNMRIEAIAPYYSLDYDDEDNNEGTNALYYYNEEERYSPDTVECIRQHLEFGDGSSTEDDAPDANQGAIGKINKRFKRLKKAFKLRGGKYRKTKRKKFN